MIKIFLLLVETPSRANQIAVNLLLQKLRMQKSAKNRTFRNIAKKPSNGTKFGFRHLKMPNFF